MSAQKYIGLLCATSLLLLGTAPIATAGIVCAKPIYNPNLVRAVQRKLRDANVGNVQVDGKWGDRTAKLLAKYQSTRKIEPSGKCKIQSFAVSATVCRSNSQM